MAKDKREEFCKDVFNRFLIERIKAESPRWERVPHGQDPPDYYLTLKGSRYAVEVTSTEVMRKVTVGDGHVSEETYHRSHEKVVEEIAQTSLDGGILNGLYLVSFDQPLTTSNFKKIKTTLVSALFDYIRRTKSHTRAPEEPIVIEGYRVCSIKKYKDKPNGVYEEFADDAWTESPEVTNFVCDLLQQAVSCKRNKFETKDESAPKILILLNTYAFAEPRMYHWCLERITSLDYFHSVFIVWGDGSISLLHSVDKNWISRAELPKKTKRADAARGN